MIAQEELALRSVDVDQVVGIGSDDRRPGPRSRASEAGTAWHGAFALIGLFLVVFGIMNFAELPLGWKDRTEQVTRYLTTTVGLGPEWVRPALWVQKAIEASFGVLALVGLVRRNTRWLVASIGGWMLVFTGWAAMDVWAADRAELQEHTLYFAAFCQMLIAIVVLPVARDLKLWLEHVRS